MSNWKVGQEVAVMRSHGVFNYPPEKHIVTKVNKFFFEAESQKNGTLEKFNIEGTDTYPRPKEKFRTVFILVEPWTDAHKQKRDSFFRREAVLKFNFGTLSDEDIAKVYEVIWDKTK